MQLELIGVPYTSAAAPGGIADAIGALRAAGLAEDVGARADLLDAGDLDLPPGDGERGRSGLLNEEALGRLVEAAGEAVAGARGRGRVPLVVGGDCPVLLGALAAGRERFGAAGLLLVDGHEDAWPPRRSETGEASDSEVAIALGRVDDLPRPLADLVPLLDPQALAMLGPRDRGEIEAAGVESLDGAVALLRDDAAVRATGPSAAAREALAALAAAAFWLHVDLDVLRTDDLPAVDYPQPGGLGWDELLEIARQALRAPGCFGCSVVIYNPELDDPQRSAATRIVRFVSDLADITSRNRT